METLNKEYLLDKFSKVLDRAEEISKCKEFIEYKKKCLKYVDDTKVDFDELALENQKLKSILKDKIQFDEWLDSTAFMIAIAGNNWLG